MKFLISINNKMINQYPPNELINSIINLDQSNNIDGAEINIDVSNEVEKIYFMQLVKHMKKNNWIVQIHSRCMYNLDEETINKYLHYYNQLAIVYGNKIKMTFHPAEEETTTNVINKSTETINYISSIIKNNNYNLEILVENLNRLDYRIGCSVDTATDIFYKTNIKGITFDIGHHAYNNPNDFKIPNINIIENIHIHDINKKLDHYPFYYNNVQLDKISEFLNKIKYNKCLVLEFAFEYLRGTTFREKIIEYINQTEYIKNILKEIMYESSSSKM